MENHVAYCNQVWNTCLQLFQKSVSLAIDFRNKGLALEYQSCVPQKEELAANSCYMHRGYYCPSPILDQVLTNAKRGKLLKHPTKRSHITNRYCYDGNGDLYLAEYISDHLVLYREYVVRDGDVRYGFFVQSGWCFGRDQHRDFL